MKLGRTVLVTKFENDKVAQTENVIVLKKNPKREMVRLSGTRWVKRCRRKVTKNVNHNYWVSRW